MKQLFSFLFILSMVFTACSTPEPNGGGDGDDTTIDKAILGKWRVEYSKTIVPAVYYEEGDDIPAGFKPGVNYKEDAKITEYLGDYTGHKEQTPQSGLFNDKEFKIDIKDNKQIYSSIAGGNEKIVPYKIEDGYLIYGSDNPELTRRHKVKYSLKDDVLTMELIKGDWTTPYGRYYIISRYSRIKE